MIKKILLIFLIIFMFTITVFADDDSSETWDLNQDIESLYEQGLVSDDVMNDYKEGILIDGAVPSQTSSFTGSSNLDNSSSNLSLEKQETIETLDNISGENIKSLSPVPSSGSAYSDPTLISIEYAEDAEDGSLLEVLYNLLGKPVKAYHYRWQSNTQGYNVYSVQVLDYDINWIASFLMLLLVIYCIFKCGGALLSKL